MTGLRFVNSQCWARGRETALGREIRSLSLFPYLLTHPQQISLQYKSIFSLLDKTIKHAFLLTTKQTVKMILSILVPISYCARKLNMITGQLENHF